MKTVLSFLGASVVVFLVLGACQTAGPASPRESMIQADSAGFSPKADRGRNTIELTLAYGNRDLLSSWKVRIAGEKGDVKSFAGDSTDLPATLTWDGTDYSGSAASEGIYTASLSIDYAGKLPAASVSSSTFVLDMTEPTGTLVADPNGFTPTDQGVKGPVTISMKASSPLAKIQSWGVDLFDPDGKLFQSFTGQGAEGKVSWDGRSFSGDWVQASRTYAALATIRDEYGLAGTARLAIPVADMPAAPAQQAPQGKVQPGQNEVQPNLLGFSPRSESGPTSIGIALSFGNPGAVRSWKLTIDQGGMGTRKGWSGDSASLPEVVTWDGRTESGEMAPDGTYAAVLSVDYGPTVDPVRVTSRSFVLDVTPPSGTIGLSSPLFSPIEGANTITLTVDAVSPVAAIDSWSMDIFDPGGNLFRSFSGKWPARQAVWDGTGTSGGMVLSAEDYPVRVRVRDELGNQGQITGKVPVDILVEKTDTGFRILSSRIWFKAYTADYRDVAPDLATQNIARLDALASKLKKFPGYRIRIVGHAVSIYWDKPALGREEQETVLIPLSRSRAEAVAKALEERGLDPARFVTEGVGAADQLVPDSDQAQRWQNRRVSLYLER